MARIGRPDAEWRAIHEVADRLEPQLRRAFLRAVEQLQASLSINDLAIALSAGNVGRARALISVAATEEALQASALVVVDAFNRGGRLGATQLLRMVKAPGFRFDGTNESAQRAVARRGKKLVTRASRETRTGIDTLIRTSIRTGIPPYDAALAIKPMVGLIPQHAQAALSYRTSLIDQGLTLPQVNRLADRYAAKLLRWRANNIARTEIMGALNAGSRESWKQAQRAGLLTKTTRKAWMITPLDACPICTPLDGVSVPLDGMFSTSVGELPGPPAHPSCRCVQEIIP